MTIFRVPWEALDLEQVEAFLADAGGEPLTWEAKGTELPRPASIAKHIGGFANAIGGGYLLLGFERLDGAWQATGLDFPNDDPPAWIASIVGSRLRPIPRIDVRDWPAAGKRAAVVQIEPVAEPPCMTTDGQVFQRVAGATVPVVEASELRRLYDRGETATAEAEAAAVRALDRMVGTGSSPTAPLLRLAFSVAPVGTASDIAAQVFAPETEARLKGDVDALPLEPLFFEEGHAGTRRSSTTQVTQDSVSVETNRSFVHSWVARVAWDGSAVGLLRAAPHAEADQRLVAETVFAEAVLPMARVVEKAARDIGGHGRAHMSLGADAWLVSLIHGGDTRGLPGSLRPVQRWANDDPWLDDGLLAGMKRELLRACGFPEWEPSIDTRS